MGTAELINHLGLSEAQTARVYHLTRHEIGVLGGGGGNPDDWQFELTPEVQRFAGVNTIERYLEVRVVPQPYPPKVADLRTLVTPSPFSAQAAMALDLGGHEEGASKSDSSAQWRRLRVVNRILEHPLIVAIVGTVVAGIILAVLVGH